MILLVTQCFQPDVGGIEFLMTGLADELHAGGREVAVLADHVHTSTARDFTRHYPLTRFGAPRPLRVFMKRRVAAAAIRRAPEAVFVTDSWKSVGAIPRHARRICVLAHGMELPDDASPKKAARIRAAFARADSIIANSAFTAQRAARFTDDAAKIVIVHPPIGALPPPSRESLEWIDGLIAGRPLALATLSRLEPRKGVDAILRVLPDLVARHKETVYFIAGTGEDSNRLRTLASGLKLDNHVMFLGRVDEQQKAALLSRADIFAMPVRRAGRSVEGYGLSYVEAAWYGAPSLAGRDGGAVDAVLDGETGLICDGASLEDVAAKLMRLADDEPLRERLGGKAAARAQGQTWASALGAYLSIIDG